MFFDIHHHLIYGIDDGAESFAGTEKMICEAVQNRVSAIIATPHMLPGIEPFPEAEYRARLAQTREWLRERGIDITLYSGAEVMYTPNTPFMLTEGRVPPLADSKLVLVEFLPSCSFEELENAGKSVQRAGYRPVYAHIERYLCLKKPKQVWHLREDCGAYIQVNADTVLRRHGFFRRRYLDSLFEHWLVDFIASDSHDMPGRENRMGDAFTKLSSQYGEDMARALTYENAERLILNKRKRTE